MSRATIGAENVPTSKPDLVVDRSRFAAGIDATAAAGRAFGLNETEMLNAFSIIYSSVAGNHQVTRDASLMKRLQPGLAAQAALVAGQLARKGIRGAQNVFDGSDRFIRVYLLGEVDAETVRKDLGRPLPLTGVRGLDLGHVFQGHYATFLMAIIRSVY